MHLSWNRYLQFVGTNHRAVTNKSIITIIIFILALALISTPRRALAMEKEVAIGGVLGIAGTTMLLAWLFNKNEHSSSNNEHSSNFEPYIGMSYGGGTIINIDTTNQKLLIMADIDQSAGAIWALDLEKKTLAYDGCTAIMCDQDEDTCCSSPYLTNTIGSGSNIATGNSSGEGNTYKIIKILGVDNNINSSAPAAAACTNYRGGGYSDWYLPSMWELEQMRMFSIKNNLNGINAGGNCVGDKCFVSSAYWSSTETLRYDEFKYDDKAWGLSFSNSRILAADKLMSYGVRAVRAVTY